MNRRQFLGTLGLGAVATTSLGPLAEVLAQAPPGTFAPANAAQRDPAAHVIARLTYGVTPDLYAQVRGIGPEAFIQAQLDPATIDDRALEPYLAVHADIINADAASLAREYEGRRVLVAGALVGSTTVRALYSQRQLYERMVEFFSDHFSVYLAKGPVVFLKVDDDRDVIRPLALGRFRDLLGASAHSPAMLVYLDNVQNERSAPNENYARELLELHTLGVDGGYSEDDVKAVASVFTGWSLNRRDVSGRIRFAFQRRRHDYSAKTVLGTPIPEGGESQGEQVLDLLAHHPSTARFVSTKLVRRFVADEPPARLVDECAQTFMQTDGDIRAVLRTIFNSDEFWNAPPKLKRPFDYTVSTLRALNFEVEPRGNFLRAFHPALQSMGQVPFMWPAPDGYPDVAEAWVNTLLTRWNIAMAAVRDEVPGATANMDSLVDLMTTSGVPLETEPVLEFLAEYLFGRPLTEAEHDITMGFVNSGLFGDGRDQIFAGLALLLAAPAFQYR